MWRPSRQYGERGHCIAYGVTLSKRKQLRKKIGYGVIIAHEIYVRSYTATIMRGSKHTHSCMDIAMDSIVLSGASLDQLKALGCWRYHWNLPLDAQCCNV